MRKTWFLFLISQCMLWVCPIGNCSDEPNAAKKVPEMVISSIDVTGNRGITTSQVLTKVRSRVGETFDVAAVDQDVKRIATIPGVEFSYYNTVTAEGKVKLTFVVVERNLARSIEFIGNKKYKAKALQKNLDFKVGDYVDLMLAEGGRKAIIDYYLKKGFPFVEITLDETVLAQGKVVYTVNEGPRVKVASIKFEGNKGLKTSALKKVVSTSNKKFLVLQKYLIEEDFEKELTKLKNVYHENGYLDADITIKREFNQDKSKVRLTYVINEGIPYTVDKILIMGNTQFDEKKLRGLLKSKESKTYNERKVSADTNEILKAYRENGYIDSRVTQTNKFVGGDKVDVEFGITEDSRYKIGKIDITGNEQTQDKVVRRILDEYNFVPGNWYNADIARGDGTGYLEKEIKRGSYMDTAIIKPAGETPGQKDAIVNVIEGQTGAVMFGGGITSDSGIIGNVTFDQKNFDVKDWPKSFGDFITGKAFKGAGQDLRISLQPGTEVSEYSISFTEPYLNNKPVSLNLFGSVYEREQESYTEKRQKGVVGFEKRYPNHWRRSIAFRLENVDITEIDSDAPKEIKDVAGNNGLAGVKFGLGRDMTNDKYLPSKGYNWNVSYEQLGGAEVFGLLNVVFKHYKTISEDLANRKTILATKILGGTVVGDAPPFEKYYAGGTGVYGIRGFKYRGVSTRGYPTFPGTDVQNKAGEKKDPIGSNWIFLMNTELAVPLASDNLAALFFIDSGTVDTGDYRVSAGTGVQILLPQWFGPVPMRFEIAAPLMKSDEDETQVFSFSVGALF
jgi:outer membrane protein insertion porin family